MIKKSDIFYIYIEREPSHLVNPKRRIPLSGFYSTFPSISLSPLCHLFSSLTRAHAHTRTHGGVFRWRKVMWTIDLCRHQMRQHLAIKGHYYIKAGTLRVVNCHCSVATEAAGNTIFLTACNFIGNHEKTWLEQWRSSSGETERKVEPSHFTSSKTK